MKAVYAVIKERVTKGELVDDIYLVCSEEVPRRTIEKAITIEHVKSYAKAIEDIWRQYGRDIDEETETDERLGIAESIASSLGLLKEE